MTERRGRDCLEAVLTKGARKSKQDWETGPDRRDWGREVG